MQNTRINCEIDFEGNCAACGSIAGSQFDGTVFSTTSNAIAPKNGRKKIFTKILQHCIHHKPEDVSGDREVYGDLLRLQLLQFGQKSIKQ